MGIKVDTTQLKAFSDRIQALSTTQKEQFFDQACKGMAGRYLALVIPATPVGKSTRGADGTNHEGGTLRRGWTGGVDGGASYADRLSASATGGGYSITITNSVEYASYVENGHRQTPGRYVPAIGKRLVKSWVPGQFFVKNTEEALEGQAPTILNTMLDSFIRRVF